MSKMTMSEVQNLHQFLGSKSEAAITNGIISSFRALLKEPNDVDLAVSYLFETLLDDATIGICMETHYQQKTGILPALDGIAEEPRRIYEMPNIDIFGISTANKSINCPCPNCDRMVAAARFAPHLQICMGLGRNSSRIALRRLNTSASGGDFNVVPDSDEGTDDKDDADWSLNTYKKKSTKTSSKKATKKMKANNF